MKSAELTIPPRSAEPGPRIDLSALAALFVLTLRQHLRGRRLIVLSLLFLLPTGLAVLVKLLPHAPDPEHLELVFIYNLIPHVLATLTALLYAAGIIQDEVEGQTLTYLLMRPLPRWALYLTKLVVTILVTAVMTGAFTLLAYTVLYWNSGNLGEVLFGRALKTTALLALALACYCAFFGVLGLFIRRALVAGLVYIVVFEGLLASLDFVARRLTVNFSFRVLALRWAEIPAAREWSIDLATAPTAQTCVLTLVGVTFVFALLGAAMTMNREFRMKTPGEN